MADPPGLLGNAQQPAPDDQSWLSKIGGLLGVGSWDPAAAYGGDLSDPATKAALRSRALGSMAQAFGQGAMPVPYKGGIPFGATLGNVAAAADAGPDQLIKARLIAAQQQQAMANVGFLKSQADALKWGAANPNKPKEPGDEGYGQPASGTPLAIEKQGGGGGGGGGDGSAIANPNVTFKPLDPNLPKDSVTWGNEQKPEGYLNKLVQAAAPYALPQGFTVKQTSGDRGPDATVGDTGRTSAHASLPGRPALAGDYQIYDDQGKPIDNKAGVPDTSGYYGRLGLVMRMMAAPEVKPWVSWGGNYKDPYGYDIQHYDLQGDHGQNGTLQAHEASYGARNPQAGAGNAPPTTPGGNAPPPAAANAPPAAATSGQPAELPPAFNLPSQNDALGAPGMPLGVPKPAAPKPVSLLDQNAPAALAAAAGGGPPPIAGPRGGTGVAAADPTGGLLGGMAPNPLATAQAAAPRPGANMVAGDNAVPTGAPPAPPAGGMRPAPNSPLSIEGLITGQMGAGPNPNAPQGPGALPAPNIPPLTPPPAAGPPPAAAPMSAQPPPPPAPGQGAGPMPPTIYGAPQLSGPGQGGPGGGSEPPAPPPASAPTSTPTVGMPSKEALDWAGKQQVIANILKQPLNQQAADVFARASAAQKAAAEAAGRASVDVPNTRATELYRVQLQDWLEHRKTLEFRPGGTYFDQASKQWVMAPGGTEVFVGSDGVPFLYGRSSTPQGQPVYTKLGQASPSAYQQGYGQTAGVGAASAEPPQQPGPPLPAHPGTPMAPGMTSQPPDYAEPPHSIDQIKAQGADWGKGSVALKSMWGQANSTEHDLMTMAEIYKRLQSGPLTVQRGAINGLLSQLPFEGMDKLFNANQTDIETALALNYRKAVAPLNNANGQFMQNTFKINSESMAHPNSQPGTNLQLLADDIAQLRQMKAMGADWAAAEARGHVDPFTFQTLWLQKNPLEPVTKAVKAEIGPFTGIPAPPPTRAQEGDHVTMPGGAITVIRGGRPIDLTPGPNYGKPWQPPPPPGTAGR